MATRRWLGQAADTTDKWTITVGGTWAAAETAKITINNKDVVITLGATVTVAEVCALAAAAFNSTDTPATDESYTPADGGQSIAEFAEYSAEVVGTTTVVITARNAGVPGTITVSETSTSGTFTIAHTVTATGKHFFDNADNWSGNTAPANSDTVVFDAGNTDCLYNLSTTLTGLTINVLPGFTGKIGLPEMNANGYDEYRTKSLTTAGGTTTVLINNDRIQRCRLAFGANTAAVVVRDTGTREDNNVPPVLLTGGDGSSTLVITRGDVGAAFYSGETAQFTTLDMSYMANPMTDAKFYGYTGLTLATLRKNGGIATFWGNVTTMTQGANGGVTTFWAGTPATANIDGGTLVYNSSTAPAGTAWRVSGKGFIDFDQDPRAKTASTTIAMYGPYSKIRDSKKVVASFAVNCQYGATAGQIDRGDNNTVTYS